MNSFNQSINNRADVKSVSYAEQEPKFTGVRKISGTNVIRSDPNQISILNRITKIETDIDKIATFLSAASLPELTRRVGKIYEENLGLKSTLEFLKIQTKLLTEKIDELSKKIPSHDAEDDDGLDDHIEKILTSMTRSNTVSSVEEYDTNSEDVKEKKQEDQQPEKKGRKEPENDKTRKDNRSTVRPTVKQLNSNKKTTLSKEAVVAISKTNSIGPEQKKPTGSKTPEYGSDHSSEVIVDLDARSKKSTGSNSLASSVSSKNKANIDLSDSDTDDEEDEDAEEDEEVESNENENKSKKQNVTSKNSVKNNTIRRSEKHDDDDNNNEDDSNDTGSDDDDSNSDPQPTSKPKPDHKEKNDEVIEVSTSQNKPYLSNSPAKIELEDDIEIEEEEEVLE